MVSDNNLPSYTPRNRQPLGMGSNILVTADGKVTAQTFIEVIRAFLPKMDPKRWVVVYIRKSNDTAEMDNSNYLEHQEKLAEYVAAAGVDADRLKVESADIGISGVYDGTYRPSLKKIEDWLRHPELIGTIIVADISRIYRDPTEIGPVILAEKLKINKVKILTFDQGQPRLLDMTVEADNDWFKMRCRDASAARKTIRHTLGTSRETSVMKGGWSGSPVPIGWAVMPPKQILVMGRRHKVAPFLYVYQPHADVKLEIMRIADKMKTPSWRQLHEIVTEKKLFIPPFAEYDEGGNRLREYMATRSCLKQIGRKQPDGNFIRYDPDEPLALSLKQLKKLLQEPLAIGCRLYGSGKSGIDHLRTLDNKFKKMGKSHDSKIRDYREFVGYDDKLAICRTEEEVALFWRILDTWGEYCVDQLRESDFTICVPKPSLANDKRGRPIGASVSSPWTGIVFCGKHGTDEAGNVLLTHHLGHHVAKSSYSGKPCNSWHCQREYNRGDTNKICVSIGNNDILGRILDQYFARRIRYAIEYNKNLVLKCKDQPSSQEVAEGLRKDIGQHQRNIERHMRALAEYEAMWDRQGMTDEEIAAKRVDYIYKYIEPEEGARRSQTVKLRDIEQESSQECTALQSFDTVQSYVEWIYQEDNWSQISKPRLQRIIRSLVSNVVVFSSDDPGISEVGVVVNWHSGLQDVLITWQSPSDDRPWEQWEDDNLRANWLSDLTPGQMRELILPARRWNNIANRVKELGLPPGRKTRVWRQEFKDLGLTWYERHNEEVIGFALFSTESSNTEDSMDDTQPCWMTFCADGSIPIKEEPPCEVLERAFCISRFGEVLNRPGIRTTATQKSSLLPT